jgi:hypothetical protein
MENAKSHPRNNHAERRDQATRNCRPQQHRQRPTGVACIEWLSANMKTQRSVIISFETNLNKRRANDLEKEIADSIAPTVEMLFARLVGTEVKWEIRGTPKTSQSNPNKP